MSVRTIPLIAIGLLWCGTQVDAQTELEPLYTCFRIPVVDSEGWPTDDVWNSLPSTGDFVKAQDGKTPNLKTEACMGWTEEGLYIRWICEDPHIWCTYTKRDDTLWNQEVVELFLSPNDDPYHYYEFEVSPNNLIVDLDIQWPIISGMRRMRGEITWNSPGCRSKVILDGTLNQSTDTDTEWQAYLFIPFSDIGLQPPSQENLDLHLRANLYRIDRQASFGDEYHAWNPTMKTPASFHVPERLGFLKFSLDTTVQSAVRQN